MAALARSSAEPVGRRIARLAARMVRTRTLRARRHAPLVSFSFDDIPDSAATLGAAILEEAGACGTFYVAGSLIDTLEPGRRLASAEQCRALHRSGHEIGCHTFSHRAVGSLGGAALAADIARNRACLQALDPGIALSSFAYPFNATSLRAKRQLERHFGSCRGGVPGINAGRIDLGFLRAVELADAFLDAQAVSGWIARAVARSGWLIFFSHGVSAEPDPWGCNPRLLRYAVREATAQGARIVPVREALAAIRGEARATVPA